MSSTSNNTGGRQYDIATIGPVPSWAADDWIRRQLEIRSKVRATFRAEPTAVVAAFPQLEEHYTLREIRYALEAMVGDGILERQGEYFALSASVRDRV